MVVPDGIPNACRPKWKAGVIGPPLAEYSIRNFDYLAEKVFPVAFR